MKLTQIERTVLVAVELFVGVMAIVGTIGLLGGFWSQGLPVDLLRGSPFTSYLIPALALFVLVGGSAFLAATLLLTNQPAGNPASFLAGIILVIFEVIEYQAIGFAMFLQPAMFALGLLLIALAGLDWSANHSPKVNR